MIEDTITHKDYPSCNYSVSLCLAFFIYELKGYTIADLLKAFSVLKFWDFNRKPLDNFFSSYIITCCQQKGGSDHKMFFFLMLLKRNCLKLKLECHQDKYSCPGGRGRTARGRPCSLSSGSDMCTRRSCPLYLPFCLVFVF